MLYLESKVNIDQLIVNGGGQPEKYQSQYFLAGPRKSTYSSNLHHHQGVPTAWIILTLSHHTFLSAIALSKSARRHPVSAQS